LTDAVSDCSTVLPRIGNANGGRLRAIGPSVSEAGAVAVAGRMVSP
jgi:hypothetical protein